MLKLEHKQQAFEEAEYRKLLDSTKLVSNFVAAPPVEEAPLHFKNKNAGENVYEQLQKVISSDPAAGAAFAQKSPAEAAEILMKENSANIDELLRLALVEHLNEAKEAKEAQTQESAKVDK